jgi:hypothetical protein
MRRALRIAAELMAMLALLLAIDQLWGGRDGFAHFHPSPYWLPVLVMAIGYGTWPGLAAAILATAAWLWTNDVSPAGRDYFAYMFDISLPPLLWYSAAVVIGEVTNVRNHRIARLSARQQAGKRNMDRLIDAFHALAQNNRALQLRIATDEGIASEALTLAARLPQEAGLERQSTLRALIAMVSRSDDFTYYRVRSGLAWPVLFGDGCNRKRNPLPGDLVAALSSRRTIIHMATPADRPLLADAGLVAVPLYSHDGMSLDGVLVLHHLPFASMGSHLNADLTALAVWLGHYISDSNRLADLAIVRDSKQ